MPEHYTLLSKFVPSGFGPGHWIADETISDRVLQQATTVSANEIRDIHDAAKFYADLLAEKEFGEACSAVIVSPDVRLANGIIFEMQAGMPSASGGYYLMETMRFAVGVSNKP